MIKQLAKERCPKCGGKVYMDKDVYGWYEKCLYCAWTRDLVDIKAVTHEEHGKSGNIPNGNMAKVPGLPLSQSSGKRRNNGGTGR
jgi:hypothetical protein